MAGGVTDPRGGMYTRAFRRAEEEGQEPLRVPEPAIEAAPRAIRIQQPPPAAPIETRPPRRRHQARPRPARIASRPLELRAVMTVAGVLVLAGMLAPLALSSGHDDPESTFAADPPAQVARLRDIALSPPAPEEAGPEEAVSDEIVATTGAATASRRVSTPPPARNPEPAAGSRSPGAQRRVDGGLVVDSQPSGARVTVNGIGYGETPLRVGYLPFGTKRVRIIKEGFASIERTVRIDAGTPRPRLSVTLRAQP